SHVLAAHFLVLLTPPPRSSPPFPYTTLFRSRQRCWRRGSPRSAVRRRSRGDRGRDPGRPVSRGARPPCGARLRTARRLLPRRARSEEHTSELQSLTNLVGRPLLARKHNHQHP